MTPAQIKLIHVASRQCGLTRSQYEMLLANVAGATSCKDLTNSGFEDCMAVLEDMGFEGHYWRDKVAARGARGTERMCWKIQELLAAYDEVRGEHAHYELAGLIERATKGRTRLLAELKPREAWNMIEGIKSMIDRVSESADAEHVPALAIGEIPI
jgi:hypothetical protein